MLLVEPTPLSFRHDIDGVIDHADSGLVVDCVGVSMLPALIPIHTVSSSEGSKSVSPHMRIQWHR